MLLDARMFESCLKRNDRQDHFDYLGNGIVLNLEDVRTFGGVAKFYKNGRGELTSSGSQSMPVRVRDPIRLPESSNTRLITNMRVVEPFPETVVAYITPTPEMAEAGLMFPFQWVVSTGDIWVNAFSMRRLEIELTYPIALLMFTIENHPEKEKKEETPKPKTTPKPKPKPKAIKQSKGES
jgi:hypothetical protein